MRRNTIAKLLLLLFWIAILGGTHRPIQAAEATVVYKGGAEQFVYLPEGNGDDLFGSFKNLMPGDTVQQIIQIQNDRDKQVKVKLYLRAEAVSEADRAFLSQLQVTVEQGDRRIFQAPADQQDGLSENVLLGTFYSGGKTDLRVSLQVPATLDNRFQDTAGTITWVFTAEELPIDSTDPTPPYTGDSSHLALYWAILTISVLSLAVLLLFWRKKALTHRF